MSDPYGVLGVSPTATDEQIAGVYKKLAKRYHPDLNPGNKAAAERMGQINQAYDDIKAERQSGNRQNSQPRYQPQYGPEYGGSPFTGDPYRVYRRYTYTAAPRRSPFGMVFAVALAFVIFRLFALLMTGTPQVQNFLYGGSSQPSYGYYGGYGENIYDYNGNSYYGSP